MQPQAARTPARDSERDAVILHYVPMVRRIVRHLSARMPSHTDRESLLGAGIVGLLSAFDKFDADKGVAFEAYARIRVRGAIQDELRAMDHLTRGQRRSARQLSETQARLEGEGQAAMSVAELAQAAELSIEELRRAERLRTPPQSIDPADFDNGEYQSAWQLTQNQEEMLQKQEQLKLIRDAIGRLGERDRQIMGMYYQDELTLDEIGDIINVSQSRVSQLIGRVKRKLREELATDEPSSV